jgi:hypothetical protein
MEKIQKIAESIKIHRQKEIDQSLSNPAIGRCLVTFKNANEIFWITNNEYISGYNVKDLNGNIVKRISLGPTTLQTDGKAVYKNTKIGEILILNHDGTHTVNAPGGDYTIEIFNRTTYRPESFQNDFASDILIKVSGDSRTHSFQSISKILLLQKEIDKEKENLSHADADEEKKLIKRIAEKEAEMQKYLDKSQGFIRKYAELRIQPILDPIQESIKRSKIFDGTLIINGGPGTGKTTSLIQRIKFLISPSIEEYKSLTKSQKDILFNQKTSWIFYSPNELLALFLRNSMKFEELNADTERVKIWSSHKNELIKAFKLVDPVTKRPFLIFNKYHGTSLFVNKPQNIQKILADLDHFYIEYQIARLNKISSIDVSNFKWKHIGLSIQNYLNEKKNINSINEIIRLFLNLNNIYKTDSNQISNDYLDLINKVAGRIQIIITKDSKRADTILNILSDWKNSNNDIDEDDEDSQIEMEVFEEPEPLSVLDFESELFNKLKSVCRKQSLKKYDKGTKFSKQDTELLKIIPELKEQVEYEKIGQSAFFKKNFERITKGIIPNVLREIPSVYKKFRRDQLLNSNVNWNLDILDELVKKDKNSRIHIDEQALLLYFINNFSFNLVTDFQSLLHSITHPYLTAYINNCKPVIAIDEATDFSIIDLLAINSFRHPEISSLTLSGDLMQRMTIDGLSKWEDFSSIVPGVERKDLKISYRQSNTLLFLAKLIYEKSTGKKANYKSFIERDDLEPKPLILVSEDDDEKLDWIAGRIIEIYKAYGDSIPSVAIFLPNENQLDTFASNLGKLDILSDVGITVKSCRNGEVLGDKNTVRIFSIDKIKGLEFEAVFFHNLDDLQKQNISSDLLLKYLYVGLSRATFYLALTLSEEWSDDLNFILKYFDRSGRTWNF